MSTNYYMVCHKCKESLHVAQNGIGGFGFYSGEPNCMRALGKFVERHAQHPLQVLYEQFMDDLDYAEVEWDVAPRQVRP